MILMDIAMPLLDGLSATHVLREHDPTEAIPILCVSTLCHDADVEAGLAEGCDGYLLKPFMRSQLIDALMVNKGLLGPEQTIDFKAKRT